MNNRIAIIDMGTNTFHLLLAESAGKGRYKIIFRDRVPVRIGNGGINDGRITSDGMERAVLATQRFKELIDQHRIDNIRAFGTSALRSASNSADVLTRIQAVTGIDVNVISGDVEAEYIYEGVRYALEMGDQKSLVMDIGGGSVEFIIANRDQIFWKKSLEIGAQRLLEQFHRHDPITNHEIKMLDGYFSEKLNPLFDALKIHPTNVLIGASGTFDTLSEVYCATESITKGDNDPETPLTLAAFHQIAEEIIAKNRAGRIEIPGMIDMRVDMIVVTCCLIRHILSRHQFDQIRVSSYSLKEGVLASVAKTMSATEFTWSQ